MELEGIMPSELERQIMYNITYMWNLGTSLVVQWLRLCLPMQGLRVESLVGEPRSHIPPGQKTPQKPKTEAVL